VTDESNDRPFRFRANFFVVFVFGAASSTSGSFGTMAERRTADRITGVAVVVVVAFEVVVLFGSVIFPS
jgi:hypothetical protein